MADAAVSVVGCKRVSIVLSEVPASAALLKPGLSSAIVVTVS